MIDNGNKSNQYIEGNSRVRLAVFAFLGAWIMAGLLLKHIAEKQIEQIALISQQNSEIALHKLSYIQVKFLIIPMSIFLIIQGAYLSRLGIKTLHSGVHPPPAIRMPFRTKIQTGTAAKIIALGYLLTGLCSFTIIALFLLMRHELLKHV